MNNKTTSTITLVFMVALSLTLGGPVMAGKGGSGGGMSGSPMSDRDGGMDRSREMQKKGYSDDAAGEPSRERMEFEHQMHEREDAREDQMRKMKGEEEQHRQRYEKEEHKSSQGDGNLPGGQEKQREKKLMQEQKELGKGSEQGQTQREEQRRKWWKFWE